MKKSVLLLGCGLVLTVLFGCQDAAKAPNQPVRVIVEGDGRFPEFLVGTWKDEKTGWEFTFEPDGTISTAKIDSGTVRVNPAEKKAKIQTKQGEYATYNFGQWTVQYDPRTRELSVDVVVESFRIPIGKGVLGGSSTDWFTGPVSDDGTLWKAEWFTFPRYILYSPEPTEFPFDPNENPIDTLMFRKQP